MSLLFWRKKKEEPPIPSMRAKVICTGMIHKELGNNEKKIKKFLTHKFRTSKSMDKPEKLTNAIYKWLVTNL